MGSGPKVKQRYTLPGWHVKLAEKEKTAVLKGLLTGIDRRRMLKGKDQNAVNMVFLFEELFIDRGIGFKENCDLTGIIVQYTDIVNKVLVYCMEVQWIEKKPSELRSETEELNVIFEEYLRRIAHLGCLPKTFIFWIMQWKTLRDLEACHLQTQRHLSIITC